MRTATRCVPAGYPERLGTLAGDAVSSARRGDDVLLLVADARGTGIAPAALVRAVVAVFDAVAANLHSWNLQQITGVLDDTTRRAGHDEDVVSALLVRLAGDGGFEAAGCGSPAPVVVRSTGVIDRVSVEPALPLGLGTQTGTATGQLLRGDRLLMHTDGMSEARDHAGELFAVEHHRDALLCPDPEAAVMALLARIVTHSGGACQDDVTLVLAEREDGVIAPVQTDGARPAPMAFDDR
ncbi:MAG: PP2C family protein-serine/threonine phosphatase [Actinomycetes bacterium]